MTDETQNPPSPWQRKRQRWLIEAVAAAELRVAKAEEASRLAAIAQEQERQRRRASPARA